MIRFWEFKLAGAPPLLSLVVRRRRTSMGRRFEDDEDEDDDEDDDDDPLPRQRGRAGGSGIVAVLSIVSMVAWGLLLVAILGGGLVFMASLGNANGAPQETALGAVFSTAFIGLYILVRCVEKIIAGIDRMQSKPDAKR
jgi:hypothetical protein